MAKLAYLASAVLLAASAGLAPVGATSSSSPGASPGSTSSGPGSIGPNMATTGIEVSTGAGTGPQMTTNNAAGASSIEQPSSETPQTGGSGAGSTGSGMGR